MASKERNQESTPSFEQWELDDVLLTDEEYEKYISQPSVSSQEDSEDYFREKFGSREDGPFSTRVSGLKYIANMSPRSDVSDSLSIKSSSSTDSDSEQQETRYSTNTAQEAQITSSISGLSTIPASLWNKWPGRVFANFGVEAYIVEPDYFLSVSKCKPRDSEEDLDEYLTINHIFGNIAQNCHPYFLKWREIESVIDSLLHAYVDMVDLPDNLHDKVASVKTVSRFQQALEGIMRTLSSGSFLLDITSVLFQWAKSLNEAIHKQNFIETLSQTYIFHLLSFFVHLMQSPITIREKLEIPLDLTDNKTKQGKEMSVETDIAMVYHTNYYIVGEVKAHKFRGKGKKPKQDPTEICEKRLRSTEQASCDSTPRRETHSSKVGSPTDENTEERSISASRAKRMKLNESEIPSTSSCGNLEESNSHASCRCGDDVKAADDSHPKETDGDDAGATSTDHEDTRKRRNFRNLRKEEVIKLHRYLPQLFAEMLAAKASCSHIPGRKTVYLGRNNETVQLAFAVEGFKLRFIRLVLRNTNSNEAPTVAMIRNANVRADMFLTKEFNLFNKKHLKMLFQMLFVFTYVYDYF